MIKELTSQERAALKLFRLCSDNGKLFVETISRYRDADGFTYRRHIRRLEAFGVIATRCEGRHKFIDFTVDDNRELSSDR